MGKLAPDFKGLCVLAFESRRATEFASLVTTFGGRAIVAPALREEPLDSSAAALEFAAALLRGDFQVVVFLTGVGTRALMRAIEPSYSREAIVAALARTKVVARGPKPLAVLRELGVPVWVSVPEPNTWRELLAALDARSPEHPLQGVQVAVQEYGVTNADLLDGLRARGAVVTLVPVYRWRLPDDLQPLKDAVLALAQGGVDIVVFTTGVQVVHLWQIVEEMGCEADTRRGLARAVVASIGPSTSEELGRHGLSVDVQASHPKMGLLVRELAERAPTLLQGKRS